MVARCLLLALLVGPLATMAIAAQSTEVRPLRDLPESEVSSECLELPTTAQPLKYGIVLARSDALPSRVSATSDAEPETRWPVENLQEIRNEAEYLDAVGKASDDIDWTSYRILVIQLTTTYKFNELESSEELSDVAVDADGIYARVIYTHHGPCEGIAQQAEWFFHKRTDLLVLLPVQPERIEYYVCIVGGCPPDIP